MASPQKLRHQLWGQVSMITVDCSAGRLRLIGLRIKGTSQTKTSKSGLICSDLKQTGKQRRIVFQHEIVPYSPPPFPPINHFQSNKMSVGFRVFFVCPISKLKCKCFNETFPFGKQQTNNFSLHSEMFVANKFNINMSS